MTTKNILLAAGSAALLATFALGQEAPPAPPPQAPVEQSQPQPNNGGWRKFGPQQQAGNAQYGDPQQQQPGNYPPPQGQQPNYGYQQQQQMPPMPPPLPAQMNLPAGTWVKLHIDRVLSSDRSKKDDVFTGSLAAPIIVNGYVIARRGQNVTGRVLEAKKAGRVKGTSELELEINELALADGQQLHIKTALVEYHGPTSYGRDAYAIGSTTVLGAAIGAAVNGGVGAGVGAAAGLLTSTVGVLVTRGHPTVIFPESTLTFKTIEPVGFSTVNSGYAFQPAGPQDYGTSMSTTRTMIGPRPGYGPYGYPGPYVYGPYGYPYGYYGGYPWFGVGTGIYIRGGGRRW